MTNYLNLLPSGKRNAISSRDLMVVLGFSSVRALQEDVAKARQDGQLVLSSTTGGYYLPANDEEVQEFVRTLEARALNTLAILKTARQYLKTDRNQIELMDLEGFNELEI